MNRPMRAFLCTLIDGHVNGRTSHYLNGKSRDWQRQCFTVLNDSYTVLIMPNRDFFIPIQT